MRLVLHAPLLNHDLFQLAGERERVRRRVAHLHDAMRRQLACLLLGFLGRKVLALGAKPNAAKPRSQGGRCADVDPDAGWT